jgi:hypothetical protein
MPTQMHITTSEQDIIVAGTHIGRQHMYTIDSITTDLLTDMDILYIEIQASGLASILDIPGAMHL